MIPFPTLPFSYTCNDYFSNITLLLASWVVWHSIMIPFWTLPSWLQVEWPYTCNDSFLNITLHLLNKINHWLYDTLFAIVLGSLCQNYRVNVLSLAYMTWAFKGICVWQRITIIKLEDKVVWFLCLWCSVCVY